MDHHIASSRKSCSIDIWQLIFLFQLILIGASQSSFQFRSVLEKKLLSAGYKCTPPTPWPFIPLCHSFRCTIHLCPFKLPTKLPQFSRNSFCSTSYKLICFAFTVHTPFSSSNIGRGVPVIWIEFRVGEGGPYGWIVMGIGIWHCLCHCHCLCPCLWLCLFLWLCLGYFFFIVFCLVRSSHLIRERAVGCI